jgi:LL-diaminopimelate aminotransferase
MLVKKVVIDRANRLFKMPPDIFSFVAQEPRPRLIARPDLIDLGRFHWPIDFDPDLVTRADALRPASREQIDTLKEELLAWLNAHAQARLSSVREIYIGGNISQMLFMLALGYLDNGDLAFVPELGIPSYRRAVIAAGGEPVSYAITSRNGWVPDFQRIGSRVGRVARMLFLNNPHNPTGVDLTANDLAELIRHAARENLLIVNDAAYQAVSGRSPVSLLAMEGGRRVSIELYSFSYQFGLPSLPFGFAAGNRDIVAGLEAVSHLSPHHLPAYVVELALHAVRQYPSGQIAKVRQSLARSAAEAAQLLELLSLENLGGPAVPFLWARIQRRAHSTTLARLLYRRYRILVAPGTSFGDTGQGFIRMSLTADSAQYAAAVTRIKQRLSLLHGRKGAK